MRPRIRLFVLTILQVLLWAGIAGESRAAVEEMDSDNPFTIGGGAARVFDGNPLDQGDTIYSVSGTYRLFRGDLGLGASIGYAKTRVDDPDPLLANNPLLVRDDNAELLLLDLHVIWYANYVQQQEIWEGHSKVKPEFTVFGGPGYASLRIKDALPQSRFGDAADDFFTLNAGVGLNLHWFQGPYRTTSRGFVRLEAMARWFGGQEDSIDLTAGVSLNYSFGHRPSCRALALRIDQVELIGQLGERGRIEELGERLPSWVETSGATFEDTLLGRQEVEDLKAQLSNYGRRCKYLRQRLEGYVEVLNDALTDLRTAGAGGN